MTIPHACSLSGCLVEVKGEEEGCEVKYGIFLLFQES